MIKLQDFARECGVTDRAIQKHLKNHESHLEGHFERRGKNGTWLDQTAQDYIRSLMVQLPPAVVDGETFRENDELKKRIKELEERLSQKEMLVEMAQRRADALQEKTGQIYALEEGKKSAEQKVKHLEGVIADAKVEIQTLTEEKAAEVAAAREEATRATEERFRSMGLLEFLRERKKKGM